MAPHNSTAATSLRSVIVVDPCFDTYRDLAAAAREGRIALHLRSSAAAALRLAGKVHADAWIVAADLDDMAGGDFVDLLRAKTGITAPVWAAVPAVHGGHMAAGDVGVLPVPVTCDQLEALIDDTVVTSVNKGQMLAKFLALPAAGIGLATSLIVIALQAG